MFVLLRIMLFPFAILYDGITRLRNFLFDMGIFTQTPPEIKSIGIGNLSVGGTGKTPHTEYLIRFFHREKNARIAVLSRGYGRKTKGFLEATPKFASPETIGDEPFQIYQKYGNETRVIVGEKRVPAAAKIEEKYPETDLLLLDDSFQHRHIRPHLPLLLSDYNRPFYKDFLLPAGRLRESRKGVNRASAIIITKCPSTLSQAEQEEIKKQVHAYTAYEPPVFFSTFRYAEPVALFEGQKPLAKQSPVLTVSGIAQTQTFDTYTTTNFQVKDHVVFADHHNYTRKDIESLVKRLETLPWQTAILTTEKDAVKWQNPVFNNLLATKGVYFLPIEVQFLSPTFDTWIRGKYERFFR